MSKYNASEIEPKWQEIWNNKNLFKAIRDPSKEKYYVLEMFPYPSGRIHMGHVRNYTMGDVVARYKASKGFNVLHPMGWDAFGMPAENAAMEQNTHPAEWTYKNIAIMREQLKPMGLSIDWSREFATCDPDYYGQQQEMFLDMLDAGLIYRKNALVNWDKIFDKLLLNILPPDTARELKKSGIAKAKFHTDVTIVFADVKSFTAIASQMKATDLVQMLELF